MTSLIILGNKNRHTFANSIVAAHHKSLELFKKPFTDIFIIDSFESYTELHKETDWIDYIKNNDVSIEALTHRIIDINPDIKPATESIGNFVNFIQKIICENSNKQSLIVDLTNSTTHYKVLLATTAYILNIQYVYMIDTIKLFNRSPNNGFASPELLKSTYVPALDNTELDKIAYMGLTEIVRYEKIIDNLSEKYSNIHPQSSDAEFFKNNFIHSINLKLRGDQRDESDNAIYRIASSSISASLEDLIRVFLNKFIEPNASIERKTLGQKIRIIQSKVEKEASPYFDLEFFRIFNDFILFLRNSTTHKGKQLTDVEQFKADLSIKMAVPFVEFYTKIVYPELLPDNQNKLSTTIKKLSTSNINSDEILYFGLDGDDTGTKLESLFLSSEDESAFRHLSTSVDKAIKEISKYIKEQSPKDSIIFATGDDLLFKGQFTEDQLKKMQHIYHQKTGFTCSIGYGKSFKDVYLALKIAKTEPEKNSIFGIDYSCIEK